MNRPPSTPNAPVLANGQIPQGVSATRVIPPTLAIETNPSNASRFLALPPELRNQIYERVLFNDIHPISDFEPTTRPALLRTCRQTASEYGPIFYGSDLVALDEYYDETDMWVGVRGHRAKRVALENPKSVFSSLLGRSGLASARRSCQWINYTRLTSRRGIMTVGRGDSVRWWRWSVLA